MGDFFPIDKAFEKLNSTPKPKKSKTYTQEELEGALRRAGFEESVVPTMSAIGMAESVLDDTDNDGILEARGDSFNPGVGKGGKPTKEKSYGPWQINLLAHPEYDPEKLKTDLDYAAKAAYDVFYKKKQGLKAWGAYTDGRYKKHYKGKPIENDIDAAFRQLQSQPQDDPVDSAFKKLQGGPSPEDLKIPTVKVPPIFGGGNIDLDKIVDQVIDPYNLPAPQTGGPVDILPMDDGSASRKAYNKFVQDTGLNPNDPTTIEAFNESQKVFAQDPSLQQAQQIVDYNQQIANMKPGQAAPTDPTKPQQAPAINQEKPRGSTSTFVDFSKMPQGMTPVEYYNRASAEQAARNWNLPVDIVEEVLREEKHSDGDVRSDDDIRRMGQNKETLTTEILPGVYKRARDRAKAREERQAQRQKLIEKYEDSGWGDYTLSQLYADRDLAQQDIEALQKTGDTEAVFSAIKQANQINASIQQIQALNKEEKIREKQWEEDTGFFDTLTNREANTQYTIGRNQEGTDEKLTPDQRAQMTKERIAQAKAEVLSQFGSFSNWARTQEQLRNKYKDKGYTAIAKSIEAGTGGAIKSVPKAVSSILKSIDIGAEAIAALYRREPTPASKRTLFKIGKDLDQLTEEFIRIDPDFKGSPMEIAGDTIGQIGLQIVAGMLTGGAAVPAILGGSMGAAAQYEEAESKGATTWEKLGSAGVGFALASSDYLIMRNWFKTASPLLKGRFFGRIAKQVEDGLVAKGIIRSSAERESAQFVDGIVKALETKSWKKVAEEKVVEGLKEMGQESILEAKGNDLYAYLTYDPSPARWKQLTTYTQENLVEGVAGFFGGIAGSTLGEIQERAAGLDEQAKQQALELLNQIKNELPRPTVKNIQKALDEETISEPPASMDAQPLVQDKLPEVQTPQIGSAVQTPKGPGVIVSENKNSYVIDYNPKPGKDGSTTYQSRATFRKNQISLEGQQETADGPVSGIDIAPISDIDKAFEIVTQTGPQQTSAAGKLKEQRDTARRAAETDTLTGVANRAALDRALPAAEADPNTSVIAFDANNFGQVNKKVSQEAGDKALIDVARSIEAAANEYGNSRVFRRGGDEFVVIAPNEVADKIRERAEQNYGDRNYGDVVVSISGTTDSTFARADSTLQEAKRIRKASQLSKPISTIEIEGINGAPSRTVEVPEGVDADALKAGLSNLESNPNFPKWFEGSTIKDKNGNPKVLYHAALNFEGDAFDPRKTVDGFIHVGTAEQADGRINVMKTLSTSDTEDIEANQFAKDTYFHKSEVIPLVVKLKNPIEMRDPGHWTYDDVVMEVMKRYPEKISEEDVDEFFDIEKNYRQYSKPDENGKVPTIRSLKREKFLEIMDKAGIDGIKYKNNYEGNKNDPNNISYALFRPEQAKSVFSKEFNENNPNLLLAAEGNKSLDQEFNDLLAKEDKEFNQDQRDKDTLSRVRQLNPQFLSEIKVKTIRNGYLRLSNAASEMIRRMQSQITMDKTGVDPQTPIFTAAFMREKDLNGFITFLDNVISKFELAGYTDEMLTGINDLRKALIKMHKKGYGLLFNESSSIPHEQIHMSRYINSEFESAIENYYSDFNETYSKTEQVAKTAYNTYFRYVYFGNKSYGKLTKREKGILQEELFTGIVDGNSARYGLTDEQAAEFIYNDLMAYVEKNGEEVLDDIEEFANEKEKTLIATTKVRNAYITAQESKKLDAGRKKGVQGNRQERTSQKDPGDTGAKPTESESGGDRATSKLPQTISEHTLLRLADLDENVLEYETSNMEVKAAKADEWLKDTGFYLAFQEALAEMEPTPESTAKRMALLEYIDIQVQKFQDTDIGRANEWYSRMVELVSNMRPVYTEYGQAIAQLAWWGRKLNRDNVVPIVENQLQKRKKGGTLTVEEQKELRKKAEEITDIITKENELNDRIKGNPKGREQNVIEKAATQAKSALGKLKSAFGSLKSYNKKNDDDEYKVTLLMAAEDKIRKIESMSGVEVSPTATQWITRNETKVKDWGQILSKKGDTPWGKLQEYVSKQFKEQSSPKAIEKLLELNLTEYLKNEHARANLNDPLIQEAVGKYNSDPQGQTKRIEEIVRGWRSEGLKEWKDYLTKENDVYKKDPFFQQYVWEGLIKLRKERPDQPPKLDRGVLAGVHSRIQGFQDNKPFLTLYEEESNKVIQEGLNEDNSLEVQDGVWIKIPQTERESPDYKKNCNMMRTLSHSNWCTSRGMEEHYITQGDFWVLTKNGKAAMAIRFSYGSIAEIQGPDNNGSIPEEYLNDVKKLVKGGKFQLSSYTVNQLIKAIEDSYIARGIPIPEFKYVPKYKQKKEKAKKLNLETRRASTISKEINKKLKDIDPELPKLTMWTYSSVRKLGDKINKYVYGEAGTESITRTEEEFEKFVAEHKEEQLKGIKERLSELVSSHTSWIRKFGQGHGRDITKEQLKLLQDNKEAVAEFISEFSINEIRKDVQKDSKEVAKLDNLLTDEDKFNQENDEDLLKTPINDLYERALTKLDALPKEQRALGDKILNWIDYDFFRKFKNTFDIEKSFTEQWTDAKRNEFWNELERLESDGAGADGPVPNYRGPSANFFYENQTKEQKKQIMDAVDTYVQASIYKDIFAKHRQEAKLNNLLESNSYENLKKESEAAQAKLDQEEKLVLEGLLNSDDIREEKAAELFKKLAKDPTDVDEAIEWHNKHQDLDEKLRGHHHFYHREDAEYSNNLKEAFKKEALLRYVNLVVKEDLENQKLDSLLDSDDPVKIYENVDRSLRETKDNATGVIKKMMDFFYRDMIEEDERNSYKDVTIDNVNERWEQEKKDLKKYAIENVNSEISDTSEYTEIELQSITPEQRTQLIDYFMDIYKYRFYDSVIGKDYKKNKLNSLLETDKGQQKLDSLLEVDQITEESLKKDEDELIEKSKQVLGDDFYILENDFNNVRQSIDGDLSELKSQVEQHLDYLTEEEEKSKEITKEFNELTLENVDKFYKKWSSDILDAYEGYFGAYGELHQDEQILVPLVQHFFEIELKRAVLNDEKNKQKLDSLLEESEEDIFEKYSFQKYNEILAKHEGNPNVLRMIAATREGVSDGIYDIDYEEIWEGDKVLSPEEIDEIITRKKKTTLENIRKYIIKDLREADLFDYGVTYDEDLEPGVGSMSELKIFNELTEEEKQAVVEANYAYVNWLITKDPFENYRNKNRLDQMLDHNPEEMKFNYDYDYETFNLQKTYDTFRDPIHNNYGPLAASFFNEVVNRSENTDANPEYGTSAILIMSDDVEERGFDYAWNKKVETIKQEIHTITEELVDEQSRIVGETWDIPGDKEQFLKNVEQATLQYIEAVTHYDLDRVIQPRHRLNSLLEEDITEVPEDIHSLNIKVRDLKKALDDNQKEVYESVFDYASDMLVHMGIFKAMYDDFVRQEAPVLNPEQIKQLEFIVETSWNKVDQDVTDSIDYLEKYDPVEKDDIVNEMNTLIDAYGHIYSNETKVNQVKRGVVENLKHKMLVDWEKTDKENQKLDSLLNGPEPELSEDGKKALDLLKENINDYLQHFEDNEDPEEGINRYFEDLVQNNELFEEYWLDLETGEAQEVEKEFSKFAKEETDKRNQRLDQLLEDEPMTKVQEEFYELVLEELENHTTFDELLEEMEVDENLSPEENIPEAITKELERAIDDTIGNFDSFQDDLELDDVVKVRNKILNEYVISNIEERLEDRQRLDQLLDEEPESISIYEQKKKEQRDLYDSFTDDQKIIAGMVPYEKDFVDMLANSNDYGKPITIENVEEYIKSDSGSMYQDFKDHVQESIDLTMEDDENFHLTKEQKAELIKFYELEFYNNIREIVVGEVINKQRLEQLLEDDSSELEINHFITNEILNEDDIDPGEYENAEAVFDSYIEYTKEIEKQYNDSDIKKDREFAEKHKDKIIEILERRIEEPKQRLEQLLDEDPPDLLMSANDKSIDEFEPDTKAAVLDLGKYKYLQAKEDGAVKFEDWQASIKNTLSQEGIDPSKLDGYYKSLYREVHRTLKQERYQKELDRIQKTEKVTEAEARLILAEVKAKRAEKAKVERENKKKAAPDKDKRTALEIAIDNEVENTDLTREDVLLAKDKNAFFGKHADEGLTPKEINDKYLHAVQTYIDVINSMNEAKDFQKAQKVLSDQGKTATPTDSEVRQIKAELQQIQKEKARKSKEFRDAIDHIVGRPTTKLGKIGDWYHRVNRSGEALLTSAVSTVSHNIIAQRGTKFLNSVETALELAIVKAEDKAGVSIFTPNELTIPVTTKFKDVVKGEFRSTSFENTRAALDAYRNGKADLITALQLVTNHKNQVVEGIMAYNPDLYENMLGRFSYGSDALHSWPIDPNMSKKGRTIESTVRKLETYVHYATALNRFQEMHFRFSTFLGTLSADLQGQGISLDTLLSEGDVKQIPRELLNRAVHRALDDTFGHDIPTDTKAGQILSGVSDAMSWVPFVMNPLLFRRFFYNANKYVLEHSPLILAKTVTAKGFSQRDAAKFITGLGSFAVATAILAAFGADDDDPTKLNIFGYHIRVSSYNPLSSWLILANTVNRLRKGKSAVKGFDDIILFTGINTRYPNPGLEWFKTTMALFGNQDNKWVKWGEQTQVLGGKGVAAFIRPLSTLKDIQAQFMEEEAIERDYAETPFTGEIRKVVPLFGMDPAPAKENVLNQQPLKEEYTLFQQLGITYIPDRQIGPKFSAAEEYLDTILKSNREKYTRFYKSPEQRKTSAIVAQLFTHIDKGVDVTTQIDHYSDKGMINKDQEAKLRTANKYKTTIERKAQESSIADIVNAYEVATPGEKAVLIKVLDEKGMNQRKSKDLTSDEERIIRTLIPNF